MHELLAAYTARCGIALPGDAAAQFDAYARLLLRWNDRINLTAITRPEDIVEKHFLDSLLLLKAVELPQSASLIDVGTGAGFPGVPVKIARPDISLTLLDSLQKRVGFLRELSDALGQDNACIHMRAEDAGRDARHRESYDCATARAVAALPMLCEYCLPLIRPGGLFVALKGADAQQEAELALQAAERLGGRVRGVESFMLPSGAARGIVVVEKLAPTPPQYPRAAKRIRLSPL